jgi:multimeric flavodoxin WrbA
MKIVVLNGSPKGDISVTMQYVHYLAKHFPEHQFPILNIAQRIKKIEADPQTFNEMIAEVRSADAVLWAFPLYFLLVHAHYKRFIELIHERGVQDAFAGKYAASLSTSIHFYDHTAHNYMHAVCDDLGMFFIEAFSPAMNDLMEEKGRKQLLQFGHHFINAVQTKTLTQRQYPPLQPQTFRYTPGQAAVPLAVQGKKVVIVHDSQDPHSNLAHMVARAQAAFSAPVQVINLHEIQINASCQGCLRCGSRYECAYEGKDAYIEFYRSTIMTADILVYAGSITDRYLSSRWKMFFDRSFFNTHTPVLGGKQIVYLFSGPFGQIPNLAEIFKGYAEFQQANFVGFITDECADSPRLDRLIDQAMHTSLSFSLEGATRPMDFLGLGGLKIFRDDIYGPLQVVFKADHKAYQRLGFYKTFPQNELRTQLLNAVAGPFLGIRSVRKQFDQVVTREMIKPLQQIVEKA